MTEPDLSTAASYEEALDRALRALGTGETADAIESAETARGFDPSASGPLFVLGLAALRLNDLGAAIRTMEAAHKLDPDGKEIVEVLSVLYGRAGNLTDGLYYAKLALTLDENPLLAAHVPDSFHSFEDNIPRDVESLYLVEAQCAFVLHDYPMALDYCQRELSVRPQSAETYQLMGRTLVELGRYEDGVAALAKATQLAPQDAEGFTYLAAGLLRQGRLSLAIDCCREALRLAPGSAAAWGQLLTTLAYCPADQWRTYPDEARAAITAIAPGPRPSPPPIMLAPKTIAKDRCNKIRIAYLIGETSMTRDLGFLEVVLANHDRKRFFIHVYQQYDRPFSDTTRLQKYANDWRPVFTIDDETLGFIIANDAVDILVDLCGAAADGRPAVLARHPAPIQISWLGLPQGSLPGTVDCLVSDESMREFDARDAGDIPPLRFARGIFAYIGPSVDIRPNAGAPPPVTANGFVTFGGVFDPARIATSAPLWAAVLRKAPQARLLLGRQPTTDPATRATVRGLFADDEIAGRILFQETPKGKSAAAHFYSSVDILLDTLPVNGAVETCEALWLGVPVVSCRGDRRIGAVGASILGIAECGEWIAKNQDEFVAVAAKLAGDASALAALRKSLPEKVKSSPLGNSKKFTLAWESALDILVEKARAEAAGHA